MDVIEIGRRIKKARGSMTLDDIALKVGVAKSTIQRYENGAIVNPKIPVLHSIANAIGVNPAWLVCKSDEMYLPGDEINTPKARKRAAKRLDKALNIAGISAADLARASEVPKSSISQYLSSDHIPSEENATRMGNVLNVNPLWLMGFDAPMNTKSTADQDDRLASILDYYQLLNDVGRDTAVACMRELTQIHDYVSQPDAYQVHADAIRQVNAIEESRNKKHRKTIS